jgi:hypothetical protein
MVQVGKKPSERENATIIKDEVSENGKKGVE